MLLTPQMRLGARNERNWSGYRSRRLVIRALTSHLEMTTCLQETTILTLVRIIPD